MKLSFQRLWDRGAEEPKGFFKEWYLGATHSKIMPMIEAARTIKDHENGVLGSIESRLITTFWKGLLTRSRQP